MMDWKIGISIFFLLYVAVGRTVLEKGWVNPKLSRKGGKLLNATARAPLSRTKTIFYYHSISSHVKQWVDPITIGEWYAYR